MGGETGVCEMQIAPEAGNNGIDYYTNQHLKNSLDALTVGINQNIPLGYRFEASTDGSGRFLINLHSPQGCDTFSYDGPNMQLTQEIANLVIEKIVHGLDPKITIDRVGEFLGYGDYTLHLYYHNRLLDFLQSIPTHE